MKEKLLIWLPIFIWILVGIYGIFYNITYIDEAKYLIKGWLITTGQIGYYTTPEFFYQHMPGGMLWYGLGQKILGPSLLAARIQTFIVGSFVMFFSYKLAKLINPRVKNLLAILSLAPVVILYYSSTVPQSLAALTLVLGFYWLYKNNYLWATAWFTLAFIVRENFLFTLMIYFGYLLIYQQKIWFKNLVLSLAIISVFFIPGWPGTINILKNFPGVSWLLPISAAEKAVLSLNWIKESFGFGKYWEAVTEFGVIYFSLFLVAVQSLISGYKNKMLWIKDSRWRLLLIITCVNLLAHTWSAFNLSPRSIIPYLAYSYPLGAVIMAVLLKGQRIKFYPLLLIISLLGVNFASIFQKPTLQPTISALNQSVKKIQPIIKDKENVIWIAEPMSLYLAGKISYYPLINHTNFYKPSEDTATVKSLGFWNQEMMDQWLNEADLLVFDPNRLNFAKIDIKQKLNNKWQLMTTPANIQPEGLIFYSNNFKTR